MPPNGLTQRESGLKLNKNKCQFRKKSIVFLGHIISSEGTRADPSKTDTITKMSVPQSLTELRGFLGMVNYLDKFTPNLAEVTIPLQALLEKDVVFNLQKPQLNAIEKFKSLITSGPILKIFNPDLPTRLKIDASSGSLGNPKWYPIGYSSIALRDYEKRYAKIEKETLSTVFGVKCFH